MPAGGLHRCKSFELHSRRAKQPQPKSNRVRFRERVMTYGYTKEQAITSESHIKKREHIIRDENGRVCNKCKQYKKRDEFSYNKVGFHCRNSACKECKNKAHREYRANQGKGKDQEYRIKKRKLNIGDQIYFNSQIREVVDKKYNGYIVENIITKEQRRISTSDNHYRPNNNCVRFTKLIERVNLVSDKEEEIIESPKFEISIDPDEDDENYYY